MKESNTLINKVASYRELKIIILFMRLGFKCANHENFKKIGSLDYFSASLFLFPGT